MQRDHSCGGVEMGLVKQRGFSMLDAKHYVESLGTRDRSDRSDVEGLCTPRVPALVLTDVRGDQLAGPMLRDRQMPPAFKIPYMF